MAISSITASYGSYAVAAVPPTYNGGSATSQPSPTATTDTVQLSSTALALSLEAAGDSPEEIASNMGLDIGRVDDYLGILPATSPAATGTNTVALTPYTTPFPINTSTFSVSA